MGYPLFLALTSILPTRLNVQYIRFVQVIIDVLVGILLWKSSKNIFSKKIADIAFTLYILNPFTASYVGIILPEILSCFIVGLMFYISTSKSFKEKKILWFFIGLVAGILVFTKPGLLFFGLGLIAFLSFLSFSNKLRWKFFAISVAGFLVASSYTLITNYVYYKKISFTPPYSTVGGQTYLMLFYANRYPEVEFWGVVPELSRIYEEYGSLPDSQIPAWNSNYLGLVSQKLINEPLNFLSHYGKNLFWLWDKDHLSVYSDPWYPTDRYFLRTVNILLIAVGIFGIILFLRKSKGSIRAPFVVATVVLAGIMSLWFPTVSNESRHTIPFYPILFFWVAYGVGDIVNSRRKI